MFTFDSRGCSAKQGAQAEHEHEMQKTVPDRYPSNEDSIGIELVGKASGPHGKEVFEAVTNAQNTALKWLVQELSSTFAVPLTEVFRHPEVSRKNVTEASTAAWQ